MTGNEFRNAIHSDRVVYGTMLVSDSPKYFEPVVNSGVDFVFICTEHIAIDRRQLSWMCQAFKAAGVVPLVRIPSPDPYAASMALDGGACGILAPYIETPEQVRLLVGAVKYKPLKGERLNNYLNKKEDLEPALLSYLEKENKDHFLLVNIESTPAMRNLDDILAVEGLDGIVIGPHDLTTSLGDSMAYTSKPYDTAVREIFTKARKAGLGAGNHVHYPGELDQQVRWAHDTGANIIIHRSDILTFSIHMTQELAYLKQHISQDSDGSKDNAPRAALNI